MLNLEQEELIHDDRDYGVRLFALPQYSDAFVEVLEQTVFGTQGLRYRRLGIREQLDRLPNALFIELRRGPKLIGTYAFSCRSLKADSADVCGVYRGHLALIPDAQGSGFGRLLVEHGIAWLARRMNGQPTLSWGCIERRNLRSKALLESLGATALGTLESRLVYRQWPRERIRLLRLEDNDQVSIERAVMATQDDCGVHARAPDADDYFAVCDANGIVAGARVTMTAIDMLSSGGRWDALASGMLRRIPAARRRFDPRQFRYLNLTDIVVRRGHQRIWRQFLPALLARHDAHMAMFLLDPRSRTSALLEEAGLFGRFADSTRQHIDVLASGWNIEPGLLDRLSGSPLGLRPLDI